MTKPTERISEGASPGWPWRGTDVFTGGSSSVTWNDTTIALGECGRYAEARSFATVKVRITFGVTAVTVWGQRFSLG